MNAEQLARALGFKRSGNQWVGRCVAHDDRESVDDHIRRAQRFNAGALPGRL